MAEPPPDDSLAGEAVAFRRIPNGLSADFIVVDEGTGRRRPSSGAFDPDEDGVSVYMEHLLANERLTAADLVRDPVNAIASITVGQVRELDLGVALDPWPFHTDDPTHPRNAAHALIVGLMALGTKARKRKQRKLAVDATLVIEPTT